MTRLHSRNRARAALPAQHRCGHPAAAWAPMRMQPVDPGPGKGHGHRNLFRKSHWTPELLHLATLSVHLPGLLIITTAMACHRSALGLRMTPVDDRPAGQLHISQKREGQLPLMCAAGVTIPYRTCIMCRLSRKAYGLLRHDTGGYLPMLRSDNHAPHMHAGQPRVQQRACSKGRQLSN